MGNGRMGAKILSEQTLLIGQEMIKVETTTLSQHLEGPFKMSLDPAEVETSNASENSALVTYIKWRKSKKYTYLSFSAAFLCMSILYFQSSYLRKVDPCPSSPAIYLPT